MGSNNDSSLAMDNVIDGKDNNKNSMSMESMDNSSSNMDHGGMNRKYSLVNMDNYQSAEALSAKASEIYNTELKPIASSRAAAFKTNLENALTQLYDAIRNKSSPTDIMTIAHTQVHPNLLQIFELGSG
jgi:hypothetical protein